jgi:hypothetical protein
MLVRIHAVDGPEQPNRGIRRDGDDLRRSVQSGDLADRNLRGEPVDDRDAATHRSARIEDEAFGDVDGSGLSSNDDRYEVVLRCRRRSGREDQGAEQERYRQRTHETWVTRCGVRGAARSRRSTPRALSWLSLGIHGPLRLGSFILGDTL